MIDFHRFNTPGYIQQLSCDLKQSDCGLKRKFKGYILVNELKVRKSGFLAL